jgi:hypothetical protein
MDDYDDEGWEKDEIQFSERPDRNAYKNTGGFASEDVGTTQTGRNADAGTNYLSIVHVLVNKYDDISVGRRNEAISFSRSIPRERLLLLNVNILVPSLLYLSVMEREINKVNIEHFSRKHLKKEINIFDFIRYIRYLKMILKKENAI